MLSNMSGAMAMLDEAVRRVVMSPVLLIVCVASVAILWLAYRAYAGLPYPKNLARLGEREGVSWAQMRKRFHEDSLSVFNQIYHDYSKKGETVLTPVFGPNDEVILPPTALPWLMRQPDDVVSSLEAQIDGIQLQHTLGHKFAYDPWGGWLLKNDLSGALEDIAAIMSDELDAAFEANFGNDANEWNEFELFPKCRMLGGQLTLRLTLGDSEQGRLLCRDPTFIEACYGGVDGMLDVAGRMAGIRKPFKPFAGPWLSRSMKPKLQALESRFEPLFRERLSILDRFSKGEAIEKPKDILQMLFDYAIRERPGEALSLRDMTKRLAVLNFGTMHQTILTLHNLILDVIASDSTHNTIAILREEVERVIPASQPATTQNHWTKANMARLTRLDSTARETLRLHPFLGRAVQRLVVAKSGVTTPDGIHLPQGSMLSILAYQSQTDASSIPTPLSYNPFRFSEPREAAADTASGKPGLNHLSFVSSSADYLPWNHGRHACPGRFLVDFEFKMILGEALRRYELAFPEGVEGRKENVWFVGFGIPPLDARVRVRRRRDVS